MPRAISYRPAMINVSLEIVQGKISIPVLHAWTKDISAVTTRVKQGALRRPNLIVRQWQLPKSLPP